MRKYELVVKWSGGEKFHVMTFDSEDEAEKAGENFKFVFGNQVEWYGVRPKHKRKEVR